jgi:hypothetical protein
MIKHYWEIPKQERLTLLFSYHFTCTEKTAPGHGISAKAAEDQMLNKEAIFNFSNHFKLNERGTSATAAITRTIVRDSRQLFYPGIEMQYMFV